MWRLGGSTDAEPTAPIGQMVTVGDLEIQVSSATLTPVTLSITMILGGVDDADVTSSFTLLRGGQSLLASGGDCDPSTVIARDCTIEFPAIDGDSAVLVARRGEELRRWVLPLG
jgi:hypothetical protein